MAHVIAISYLAPDFIVANDIAVVLSADVSLFPADANPGMGVANGLGINVEFFMDKTPVH